MKILMLAFMQLVGLLLIGFPLHANPPADDTAGKRNDLLHAAEMTEARAVHQATLLDSGEVLVSGGCNNGCSDKLASVEIHTPGSGRFSAVASMASARAGHTATRLPDGRVLVAGGWSNSGTLDSAEIFDPATRAFIPAARMQTVRAGHVAVPLTDGRVLLTGGQRTTGVSLDSLEIFDPGSAGFSAAGSMQVPRNAHAAVRLADERVLITGGHRARGEVLRSAEIFDPATGVSERTGDMQTARHKHAAILLNDGKVLVVGGSGARDHDERFASTEIYDPGSGKFTPGPDLQNVRHKIVDALVLLPSGKVLIAGGARAAEIYDPIARKMYPVSGTLDDESMFATATVLPDGKVMITGGYDRKIRSTHAAWIFVPAEWNENQ